MPALDYFNYNLTYIQGSNIHLFICCILVVLIVTKNPGLTVIQKEVFPIAMNANRVTQKRNVKYPELEVTKTFEIVREHFVHIVIILLLLFYYLPPAYLGRSGDIESCSVCVSVCPSIICTTTFSCITSGRSSLTRSAYYYYYYYYYY